MGIRPDLSQYLTYDPETGVLHWKVRVMQRSPAGSVAGKKRHDGYITVKLHGREMAAHRAAWFLMVGSEPNGSIDHINRDPSDNRWCNLRLATASQNAANTGPRGARLKGVTKLPHGKFQAALGHMGRRYYLGSFDTEQDAHEAYMAKAIEVFGEFASAS